MASTTNYAAARVVVIGAGVAGLSAALLLAARGLEVTVLERAAAPGGKMREVAVGDARIDGGPTVFTMRWVFEELFAEAAGAKKKKGRKKKDDDDDEDPDRASSKKGAMLYYRVTCRDNGCGMRRAAIPDALGRVLAGSKYLGCVDYLGRISTNLSRSWTRRSLLASPRRSLGK